MPKWMLLCAMISAISGCASKPEMPVPQMGACSAFVIIHPSRQDTPDTKRQVLMHNRVYRSICQ